MTKNEIAEKIALLRDQKLNTEGTKCEIYSRVVGYLRPVVLWNEGKKAEYKVRKNYSPCK